MPIDVAAAVLRSAAAEPQNSRCSLPGERICATAADDDVEIEGLRCGAVYCAESTVRMVTVDAEAFELRLVGKRDAFEQRIVEQELDGQRSRPCRS